MRISKRQLLRRVSRSDLWRELSGQEVRLYFLLVVCADQSKGEGRLNWKDVRRCLGSDFQEKQLGEASRNLQRFHLAKIDYSSEESEIRFKLLGG